VSFLVTHSGILSAVEFKDVYGYSASVHLSQVAESIQQFIPSIITAESEA